MGELVKAAQYGLGAVAIVAATYLVNVLITKFAESKKEPDSNGDSITRALEKNTEAITRLTTFLETRADADKELRHIQDERMLAILGKAGEVEKVVNAASLKTCQILEQLNKRPCMK